MCFLGKQQPAEVALVGGVEAVDHDFDGVVESPREEGPLGAPGRHSVAMSLWMHYTRPQLTLAELSPPPFAVPTNPPLRGRGNEKNYGDRNGRRNLGSSFSNTNGAGGDDKCAKTRTVQHSLFPFP